MEAAHIIPYSLNNFNEKNSEALVRRARVSSFVGAELCNQKEATWTWDMLQMWTSYDIKKLSGKNINKPANAIFMTAAEHVYFGRFAFYLEKVGLCLPHESSLNLVSLVSE
jgi:hypothetical protein